MRFGGRAKDLINLRDQLLTTPKTIENSNPPNRQRMVIRRDTIALDKQLVKKLSKSSLMDNIYSKDNDNEDDDDDDDDEDDFDNDDNDNERSKKFGMNGIRNLLNYKSKPMQSRKKENNSSNSPLLNSSFLKLIQENETLEVPPTDAPPISSPIYSNKKTSLIFHTQKEPFVKLSNNTINLLMRLASYKIFAKSNDEDENSNDGMLDITMKFKDALNVFNNEIIQIGMALPLDLIDNGAQQDNHNNYPDTRIFYFVCQRGPRQIMHILADYMYKFGHNFNVTLLLSGLQVLLLPMEALKRKMKQIENNENLDWPKNMTKVFLNWSAIAFQELASFGAIPLLAKIIQQTNRNLNPSIQLIAYAVLQQLIVVSDVCITQLLYDPPVKEKQSHLNVIDRLREENNKKVKKISDEELLLKMKKTVESDFRQTLHEKDIRESIYRRTYKNTQSTLKPLKKKDVQDMKNRAEHFSFIDYGSSSCISILLTSTIYNQNRHEVVGNFAAMIWVMIYASDEEITKKAASTLSDKIKIDKLKEPYKSYKDTKQKLTLGQFKEAVANRDNPSSELKQFTVLEFLINCLKRYRPQVLESLKNNERSKLFSSYAKICKTIYFFMSSCESICSSVMETDNKSVLRSFDIFAKSESMMKDISKLRTKIAMVREKNPKSDKDFNQNKAVSTLKLQKDDPISAGRPRSAPTCRHKITNKDTNHTNEEQHHKNYSHGARPKSASAVESFNSKLIGEAPNLPKKLQLQTPLIDYPLTILSPEQKIIKFFEHKKALEMAKLLQEALTPKPINQEENIDEFKVHDVLEPITFDIDSAVAEIDFTTLQKLEDQSTENRYDMFQDQDFDKTINDVLIIRSMRNAMNDSKDMNEFYNTIKSMDNINLTSEQINKLYIAISNDEDHKECLKILNE